MAWPRKIAHTKPSERPGLMRAANEAAARARKRDFVQRVILVIVQNEGVGHSDDDDARVERAIELYNKIEESL